MFTYKLKYGSTTRTCTPSGQWLIESQRLDKCAGFRRVLSGTLYFLTNDYEYIRNVEQTNPYGLIDFEIYEDGVLFWQGMFAPVHGSFDSYKGTFTVTPIVRDKYSPMVQDWEENYNLMALGVPQVKFGVTTFDRVETLSLSKTYTYPIETPLEFRSPLEYNTFSSGDVRTAKHQFTEAPAQARYIEFWMPTLRDSTDSYDIPAMSFWFAFLFGGAVDNLYWQKQWLLTGYKVTPIGLFTYRIDAQFSRQVKITFNDTNNVAVIPEGEDGEWSLNYSDPVLTLGRNATKWFRQADFFYKDYDLKAMTIQNTDVVIPADRYNTQWILREIYQRTAIALKLITVFGGLLRRARTDSNISGKNNKPDDIISNFFTDVFNPITGETNIYIDTYLCQNSLISTGTFDTSSTDADMNLKQLLTSVCTAFNLLWDVEGDTIRIEHQKYWFDAALSNNVTNQTYTKSLQAYTYKGSSIPRTYNIQFTEKAEDIEVDGVPIVFSEESTAAVFQDMIKVDNATGLGNSVAKVITETTKKGFTICVLEAIEKYTIFKGVVFSGFIPTFLTEDILFHPVLGQGIITGLNYYNQPMLVSELQDNFFQYNQMLKTGRMNGIVTTFENSGFIKEQTLSATMAEPQYLHNVTTELGKGRVVEYTFTQLTRLITLTIDYNV